MKNYIVLLLTLILLGSCVRYDAEEFTGHTLPRITGYNTGVTNDWMYFNLRTGQVFNRTAPNQDISEGEQYHRTDWDLAFCGHRLRTNSGTSGIGKGGAADLGYGEYDKWMTASQLPRNLTWAVDDSTVSVTYSKKDWIHHCVTHNLDIDAHPWFDPNSGPATTYTSAYPILANAVTFLAPPPVYTPSFHTYVVRTADGKRYFKLQIVSWYHAEAEIGDSGGRISYYLDELKE